MFGAGWDFIVRVLLAPAKGLMIDVLGKTQTILTNHLQLGPHHQPKSLAYKDLISQTSSNLHWWTKKFLAARNPTELHDSPHICSAKKWACENWIYTLGDLRRRIFHTLASVSNHTILAYFYRCRQKMDLYREGNEYGSLHESSRFMCRRE